MVFSFSALIHLRLTEAKHAVPPNDTTRVTFSDDIAAVHINHYFVLAHSQVLLVGLSLVATRLNLRHSSWFQHFRHGPLTDPIINDATISNIVIFISLFLLLDQFIDPWQL